MVLTGNYDKPLNLLASSSRPEPHYGTYLMQITIFWAEDGKWDSETGPIMAASTTTQSHDCGGFPESTEQPVNWPVSRISSVSINIPWERLTAVSAPLSPRAKSRFPATGDLRCGESGRRRAPAEWTFAAYDINRRNVYVQTSDTTFSLAGDIATKGIELAGAVRPIDGFKFCGNLALT
jgi:hypothetical protein